MPRRTLNPAPAISATSLTDRAISDFEYVFNLFDLNNDGTIDAQEFAQIIELLGDQRPSEPQLKSIIREAANVPQGHQVPSTLSFQHFLNFFAVYDTNQYINDDDVFALLDTDRNGIISSRELAKTLHAFGLDLNQDEVDAMADFASERHNTTHFSRAEFQQLSLKLGNYRRSLCQKKTTLDDSLDESD